MASAKVQCVLCEREFTPEQIQEGLLDLGTMVCGYCYLAMQKKSYAASCFGKPTVYRMIGGKPEFIYVGYHPQAVECQRWCPDRKVCRKVVGDA